MALTSPYAQKPSSLPSKEMEEIPMAQKLPNIPAIQTEEVPAAQPMEQAPAVIETAMPTTTEPQIEMSDADKFIEQARVSLSPPVETRTYMGVPFRKLSNGEWQAFTVPGTEMAEMREAAGGEKYLPGAETVRTSVGAVKEALGGGRKVAPRWLSLSSPDAIDLRDRLKNTYDLISDIPLFAAQAGAAVATGGISGVAGAGARMVAQGAAGYGSVALSNALAGQSDFMRFLKEASGAEEMDPGTMAVLGAGLQGIGEIPGGLAQIWKNSASEKLRLAENLTDDLMRVKKVAKGSEQAGVDVPASVLLSETPSGDIMNQMERSVLSGSQREAYLNDMIRRMNDVENSLVDVRNKVAPGIDFSDPEKLAISKIAKSPTGVSKNVFDEAVDKLGKRVGRDTDELLELWKYGGGNPILQANKPKIPADQLKAAFSRAFVEKLQPLFPQTRFVSNAGELDLSAVNEAIGQIGGDKGSKELRTLLNYVLKLTDAPEMTLAEGVARRTGYQNRPVLNSLGVPMTRNGKRIYMRGQVTDVDPMAMLDIAAIPEGLSPKETSQHMQKMMAALAFLPEKPGGASSRTVGLDTLVALEKHVKDVAERIGSYGDKISTEYSRAIAGIGYELGEIRGEITQKVFEKAGRPERAFEIAQNRRVYSRAVQAMDNLRSKSLENLDQLSDTLLQKNLPKEDVATLFGALSKNEQQEFAGAAIQKYIDGSFENAVFREGKIGISGAMRSLKEISSPDTRAKLKIMIGEDGYDKLVSAMTVASGFERSSTGASSRGMQEASKKTVGKFIELASYLPDYRVGLMLRGFGKIVGKKSGSNEAEAMLLANWDQMLDASRRSAKAAKKSLTKASVAQEVSRSLPPLATGAMLMKDGFDKISD